MTPKALNIQITTGDPRPIFKQIVDGVRMQVAMGHIGPGDALPSYRGLAAQLTINPNTVAKAYSLLTSQGLLESRKGLGLFVAMPREILSRDEKEQRLNRAIDTFVTETVDLNWTDDQIIKRLKSALSRISQPGTRKAG